MSEPLKASELTARDVIAAAVLGGMMSRGYIDVVQSNKCKWAYEWADALLEARKKAEAQ